MTSSTIQSRALAFGLACFILGLADAHANGRDLSPLGVFASQTDVGSPALKGSTVYDPETQSYTLSGAGTNMWFDKDEFHFVYKPMKGDFILHTRTHFLGQGVNAHRKLGWIVRSALDTDSPHINAVVHGDGLTSLQLRRTTGGKTEEIRSELTGADVIQLERRGDRYTMSVARFGKPFVVSQCADLKLGDEVYVGLFICSHDPEVIEKAIFKDVRITIPAAEDLIPYREYLGSRLETLDVDTGDRRVLFRTAEGIEAPNWTPDGSTLIYNSRGKLFRFPLAEKKPVPLDTGFANHCNNDHVLSFDGKTLALSHHPQETDGKSVIYTLPATGGEPKRVTDYAPSYLHGWSPDGKYLTYTGQRNGDFDIYRISVDGGQEVRLTTAEGLDDGPEYSPDGKYIYFNSARTGTMQLWRMKPDGTGQQQLTHDELNDWFPHVSPDGKRIVFLSFAKDVAADQHPFYKHIYLRMMPIEGGDVQVVAYVYGGQGTINVASWSPDSRHLAFVSHTNW
jgi:TolB protein